MTEWEWAGMYTAGLIRKVWAGRRGQVQVVVTAGQEGSEMTGESWQGKQSRYMRTCGEELADTSSFKSALRDEKGT